jgi:hypothetical protein
MEPETPFPTPRSTRRLHGVRLGVAVAVVTGVVAAGGAVAWALSAGDDPSADQATAAGTRTPAGAQADEHDHDHDATATTVDDTADTAAAADADEDAATAGLARADGEHAHHEQLPPYDQRYADASDDERQAADDLRTAVRGTLAAYADPDAAIAAGYRPGPHARGPIVHYANPQVLRDGHVLDPSHPNGLVYSTPAQGEPVLLGAFFVVPPDTPAPTPAGDLLVWHSHNPSCPQFFVTDGRTDCLDTRRMVHVWTVDQVSLTSRRTGQPVEVRITDPFGAPFRASVERVR